MIHLILGGARSGKSSYAESEALSSGKAPIYIATATADDKEMKSRIQRHQEHRRSDWHLIEEPLILSHLIENYGDKEQIILIDCMTLWVSNWLCKKEQQVDGIEWSVEKERFLLALKNSQKDIIVVSNEVGSGIMPLGELTRDFVDRAGWLNQAIARVADKVTLVVAGIPTPIKTTTKAKLCEGY